MLELLKNECPVCRKGEIYSGILSMNRKCPGCGFRFEREEGYFIGSMIMNYTISGGLALPVFVAMLWTEAPLFLCVAIPALLSGFFTLVFIRPCRLVWIHLDHRFRSLREP